MDAYRQRHRDSDTERDRKTEADMDEHIGTVSAHALQRLYCIVQGRCEYASQATMAMYVSPILARSRYVERAMLPTAQDTIVRSSREVGKSMVLRFLAF